MHRESKPGYVTWLFCGSFHPLRARTLCWSPRFATLLLTGKSANQSKAVNQAKKKIRRDFNSNMVICPFVQCNAVRQRIGFLLPQHWPNSSFSQVTSVKALGLKEMAQACSPGPAALLGSLPAGPHTSANPELQSFWCPSCEICCANDAILFCRNDKAFLCALCDYKIHQNNPLAARHEVVAVSDRTDAEVRIGDRPGNPKTCGGMRQLEKGSVVCDRVLRRPSCSGAVALRSCPRAECDAQNLGNVPQGGLQKTPRADELVKVEFTTEPAAENRTIASDLSCISSTSGHGMLKCTASEALLDALNDPSVLELFPAGNLDGTIDEFQVTDRGFVTPSLVFPNGAPGPWTQVAP